MAKGIKGGKQKPSSLSSKAKLRAQPVYDRRALEKTSSDLTRLLAEQSFASLDEANAFLSQHTGMRDIPSPSRELTLQERAQDKMYEAWGEHSRKRRVKLANEALEISSDCADAFVLLAEETTRTTEDALKLYEEGMRAGERRLGREMFERERGHFWGILATRPYMRARAGVAECLWEMDEADEAIKHFKELLELNPNDNQGNRYRLAQLLLEEKRDDELKAVLDKYKDEASTEWLYTRALLLFRAEGASRRAKRALQTALAGNVYVPLFMLEMQPLPIEEPDYIEHGEESEGSRYVINHEEYWWETEGAMEWLAAEFEQALEVVERKIRAEENEQKLRRLMGH